MEVSDFFTEIWKDQKEEVTLKESSLEISSENIMQGNLEKTVQESVENVILKNGIMYQTEALAVEPEIRTDVPDCSEAFVSGNPFDNAHKMDFKQGDNPFYASGNCGLVSIANTLSRGGLYVSEDEVTEYAIHAGQCTFNPNGPISENGGTDAIMRKNILEHFGMPSYIADPENGGSPEQIAKAIEEGKGVLIGVNAGILWNNANYVETYLGMPIANHCVSVTGVARDANSGELKGFYIADSGRGLPEDANRFLTIDEFNDVYTNIIQNHANITTKSILEG